jgi:hypothetical protein
MKTAPKRATFKTQQPRVSDTTIKLVRAAARRYVLAGGSVFPSHDDTDVDQHIGNVRRALHPHKEDAFERELKALDLSYEAHESLWGAAISNVADEGGAAFLFGAFVGMEFASLGRPATDPARLKKTKGGKR